MKPIDMSELEAEWFRLGQEGQNVVAIKPPGEGWMLSSEIGKLWGRPKDSVNKTLARMFKNGKIERWKGPYSTGYYWRIKKTKR